MDVVKYEHGGIFFYVSGVLLLLPFLQSHTVFATPRIARTRRENITHALDFELSEISGRHTSDPGFAEGVVFPEVRGETERGDQVKDGRASKHG
jgi:hypothetical protein